MQVVRGRYSSLNLPGGLFYVFCCKWKLLEREFLRQPGVRLLAARGRGLGFRAIHKIFQLFTGLEDGNFLGRHFDLLAGFRIAADSSAALPSAEAAESADLDLLALLQGTNDAIENSFDDGLRLLAGKLCDTQNFFDEVGLRECGLLGHRRYASSRNSRLKTALVRPPSYGRQEHRLSQGRRNHLPHCACPKQWNQTTYGGLAPCRSAPFLSLK